MEGVMELITGRERRRRWSPADKLRIVAESHEPGALIRASRHARMVVVGSRGSGGAALLGPVAEDLLRRCASPTVFVHGATAARRPSTGTVPPVGALAS